jgi:hypothetical protein
MPMKGAKFCGARCRTKGGAPCEQLAMANGRCKMHGGVFCRREIHGCDTLRAKSERKKENAFLREMKAINEEIRKATREK